MVVVAKAVSPNHVPNRILMHLSIVVVDVTSRNQLRNLIPLSIAAVDAANPSPPQNQMQPCIAAAVAVIRASQLPMPICTAAVPVATREKIKVTLNFNNSKQDFFWF